MALIDTAFKYPANASGTGYVGNASNVTPRILSGVTAASRGAFQAPKPAGFGVITGASTVAGASVDAWWLLLMDKHAIPVAMTRASGGVYTFTDLAPGEYAAIMIDPAGGYRAKVVHTVIDAPSPDPHFANVVSLLHMEAGAIVDVISANTWTSFAGGGSLVTDHPKFGYGARYVNDSAISYSLTPHSESFVIGTSPYTFEAWGWTTDLPTSGRLRRVLFRKGISGFSGLNRGFSLGLIWDGDKAVAFAAIGDNGTSEKIAFGTTPITVASGYHHFAGVYAAGVLTIFVDGIAEGTVAVTSPASNTEEFRLFQQSNNASWQWAGWVDEVRLTKGVARYTTNFNPPTKAFPDSGP